MPHLITLNAEKNEAGKNTGFGYVVMLWVLWFGYVGMLLCCFFARD